MWKANNMDKYPTKVQKMDMNDTRTSTRAVTSGRLIEVGVSTCSKNSFYNDGVKAWIKAPDSIRNCESIWSAKKEIKLFVKNLPV